MSISPQSMAAAERLRDTVLSAGATMTIATGRRSVTIGADQQGEPMGATYVDPHTGEVQDERPVKDLTVEAAQLLVDEVWDQVKRDYNVAPLTALKIAAKVVNAVFANTVKEHVDILAEPLKPRQMRMMGVD